MNNSQRSFTLMELLIVIAVIAILAAIVLVSLDSARQSANESRGMQFSQNIKSANATDLVGEWSLDSTDIQGVTARDASGNGNNGTLVASPISVQGKVREALQFNGSTQYIDCQNRNFNFTDAITLEAWVKITSWTQKTYAGAIYKANTVEGAGGCGTNYALATSWWSPYPEFFITTTIGGNSCQHLTGSTILEMGKWYHLAGTYNSSTGQAKIYLNGKIDAGPVTYNGKIPITSHSVMIGRGAHFFNGVVDEVRIYKTALTAKEIQQLYAEGKDEHLAEK